MPYADHDKALAKCREHHAANRESANARRKAAYHAADKAIERAKRRAWYEANKEKALETERERQYKIRYGICIKEYESMLAEQGGVCAICGTDNPGNKKASGERYSRRYFSVDHDHATGKVRGLLCNHCNVSLGVLEGWAVVNADRVRRYLHE